MQFASVAAAEVTGFHRKGETRLGEEFDVTNQLQPAAVPSKTVAVEEKNKLHDVKMSLIPSKMQDLARPWFRICLQARVECFFYVT